MQIFTVSSTSKKTAKLISGNNEIVFSLILKSAIKDSGIVVGDSVIVEERDGCKVISKVLSRKTKICRQDSQNKNKTKLIAANVEKILVLSTVIDPEIKAEFIFRSLCLANIYAMDPILVFNKQDLFKKSPEKFKNILREIEHFTESIGIQTVVLSCKTEYGLSHLKKILHGYNFVIIGQSGTGKSMLTSLLTTSTPKTASLNKRGKGCHTTTQSQAVPTDTGGFCIDTPGIQEISHENIPPLSFSRIFPGLKHYIGKCKYTDCIHINTQGCKLLENVTSGIFPAYIYNIYVRMHTSNIAIF